MADYCNNRLADSQQNSELNLHPKKYVEKAYCQWRGIPVTRTEPHVLCSVFYNSEPLKFPNGFGKGIFATWLIEG